MAPFWLKRREASALSPQEARAIIAMMDATVRLRSDWNRLGDLKETRDRHRALLKPLGRRAQKAVSKDPKRFGSLNRWETIVLWEMCDGDSLWKPLTDGQLRAHFDLVNLGVLSVARERLRWILGEETRCRRCDRRVLPEESRDQDSHGPRGLLLEEALKQRICLPCRGELGQKATARAAEQAEEKKARDARKLRGYQAARRGAPKDALARVEARLLVELLDALEFPEGKPSVSLADCGRHLAAWHDANGYAVGSLTRRLRAKTALRPLEREQRDALAFKLERLHSRCGTSTDRNQRWAEDLGTVAMVGADSSRAPLRAAKEALLSFLEATDSK